MPTAKMRFKLLSGLHSEGGKVYRAKDPQNNVIESETNLAEKFGEEKFQRIDNQQFVNDSQASPESAESDLTEDDGLDEMTVDDLRKYAADMQIDLGHATRKADIVQKIRTAQGE